MQGRRSFVRCLERAPFEATGETQPLTTISNHSQALVPKEWPGVSVVLSMNGQWPSWAYKSNGLQVVSRYVYEVPWRPQRKGTNRTAVESVGSGYRVACIQLFTLVLASHGALVQVI